VAMEKRRTKMEPGWQGLGSTPKFVDRNETQVAVRRNKGKGSGKKN
jgi:hypothetical protein